LRTLRPPSPEWASAWQPPHASQAKAGGEEICYFANLKVAGSIPAEAWQHAS